MVGWIWLRRILTCLGRGNASPTSPQDLMDVAQLPQDLTDVAQLPPWNLHPSNFLRPTPPRSPASPPRHRSSPPPHGVVGRIRIESGGRLDADSDSAERVYRRFARRLIESGTGVITKEAGLRALIGKLSTDTSSWSSYVEARQHTRLPLWQLCARSSPCLDPDLDPVTASRIRNLVQVIQTTLRLPLPPSLYPA